MNVSLSNSLQTKLTQTVTLAPQMRQSLKMLAMNLPELRTELQREMSTNPVIEDVEPTLDKAVVSDQERESDATESADRSDYPEDDIPDAVYTADADALERRQRFFDSQTKKETLEEHLLAQLPVSDIDEKDQPLAEILIGDLDDSGLFAGSIPDIMMVSGENDVKIRGILKKISELDPPGCGAANIQDCLLAQLDKLEDSPYREDVRELIQNHLEDIGRGRISVIEKDMGISHERYADILKELRTLDPRPGRAYRRGGRGAEYVNPEVHAVKTSEGWDARVDARSLPEIRISRKYLQMLEDPKTDKETKAYVRERIAAANAIREAVVRRQETITSIAQAIFDAQPGFFEEGLKGLKPLTMQEIAQKVGVHHTTVSRTVRDKYASTPKGTVELRKFFTSGFVTDSGEQVSKDNVIDRLKTLIAGENLQHPHSDEKLSEMLKAEGFPVARRTVAKYRTRLGIPGASERRQG